MTSRGGRSNYDLSTITSRCFAETTPSSRQFRDHIPETVEDKVGDNRLAIAMTNLSVVILLVSFIVVVFIALCTVIFYERGLKQYKSRSTLRKNLNYSVLYPSNLHSKYIIIKVVSICLNEKVLTFPHSRQASLSEVLVL